MTTIVKYQPKLAYTTDFEKESGSLIKLKNGNKETKINFDRAIENFHSENYNAATLRICICAGH